MGLLDRIRKKLGGSRPPAAIGMAFTPEMHEVWGELEEQVDGYVKRAGTSIVGAWEVATAELARSIVGRAEERTLVERFSDAIVPTMAVFQDVHKAVPGAMQEGLESGRAAGDLTAATRPLVKMVYGLDERAAVSWEKTTNYLDPIFALCADPEAEKARFRTTDVELRRACHAADAALRDRLSRLPQAAKLWDGVTDAFDAWAAAITRELEIALDKATRPLVAAIRENRP